MKKHLTFFTFCIVALIFTGCTSRQEPDSKDGAVKDMSLLNLPSKNPYSGDDVAIKEGAQLFDIKCSQCHGLDGTGSGAGPNLILSAKAYSKDNQKSFKVVYFGTNNGMPTWKKDLGVDKIWKVLAFVESLAFKK